MSGCGTGCDAPQASAPEEATIVMRGSLADLQRAAERLGHAGVEAAIVNLSADPSSCCSPKFSLLVAHDDVAAARQVFDREWQRGLTDEQRAALEAASEVVLDPDAPETTCPACLTTFETGPSDCPDCGLALGI